MVGGGRLILSVVLLLKGFHPSLGFTPVSFLLRRPAVAVGFGETAEDTWRVPKKLCAKRWMSSKTKTTNKFTKLRAESKGFGVSDRDRDKVASEKAKASNVKAGEGAPSVYGEAFVEQMDDERRNNLYQTLLRDLQIEGVPILEVDVLNDDVSVLFAALWTILSQLMEEADASPEAPPDKTTDKEGESDGKLERDNSVRACVVINGASVDTLKKVANYMDSISSDASLASDLPELRRIKSVSLLGRGVGPALELAVFPRDEGSALLENGAQTVDEDQVTHSSLTFLTRMVGSHQIHPSGTATDVLSVGYRLFPGTDMLSALAAIWTCVCEVMAMDASAMGSASLFLTLPGIAPGMSTQSHNRFLAAVEMIDRAIRETMLSTDDERKPFRVAYFHPAYDRSSIEQKQVEFVGHLPSVEKLRPLIPENSSAEEAQTLNSRSDQELSQLQNYQRRSPNFAVQFIRPQQESSSSDTIKTYISNLVTLVELGEEKMQSALKMEMEE